MRTEQAQAGQPPDKGRGPRGTWRIWLPFVVKPLRRGVVIFILVLIIEYLVVPELVGASKDLSLLGQVNALWLAAGAILHLDGVIDILDAHLVDRNPASVGMSLHVLHGLHTGLLGGDGDVRRNRQI